MSSGRRGVPARHADTVACIVVPQSTYRPEPLAAALRRAQPEWEAVAVWCGDPQLRPQLAQDVQWRDVESDDRAVIERETVAYEPHVWEWRRALAVASELLADGAASVVLVWAGSVAVLGSLEPLVRGTGRSLTLVPRVLGPLPDDGRAPGEQDLVVAGPFSTTVVTIAAQPDGAHEHVIGFMDRMLARSPDGGVGPWLALAAEAFGAGRCDDQRIGAGAWRWGDDTALLDLPSFDPLQPWVLDPDMTGAARISVVGQEERERALVAAAEQLTGRRTPLMLPGAVTVDPTIRRLVRDADEAVPMPWSAAADFRRWVESRYWPALHGARQDLRAAFPEPVVRDAAAFRSWTRSAFAHDTVPFPIRHGATPRLRLTVEDPLRVDGLNLVGYLTRESSLGDVARRVLEGLRSAHVPVSTIASQRTASPLLRRAAVPDQRVAYEASLAIVTADQFPLLAGDLPELFESTQRMIGYWFWELEHIPQGMVSAIDLVDEVWAGSQFVADAFAAVSPVPVRHVPIPIPEPTRSDRSRGDFEPLAPHLGRFVFVTAFDHLSVTERKNPLGTIDAFCRAFAPGEGPLLLIKTMNGEVRWAQHQRVLAAARRRPDVVVWDAHLSRADQMALVASADCLVSLHRSEGLGLHLAEAMWLETPTIATRYSGNVDFMDDSCSLLVGHRLVRVSDGQGVYPPTAWWADPDLDEAAAAMRAIVADGALRTRLAAAGRARMEGQPTLAETGRLIASLLDLADRRQ